MPGRSALAVLGAVLLPVAVVANTCSARTQIFSATNDCTGAATIDGTAQVMTAPGSACDQSQRKDVYCDSNGTFHQSVYADAACTGNSVSTLVSDPRVNGGCVSGGSGSTKVTCTCTTPGTSSAAGVSSLQAMLAACAVSVLAPLI